MQIRAIKKQALGVSMGIFLSSAVLLDKIVRTGWNYVSNKHENNSKKSVQIPRTLLKQEQAVMKSSSHPRANSPQASTLSQVREPLPDGQES